MSEECGGCPAAQGHSGNSSLLPASGGMMQDVCVCVCVLLIECVFVCYRWTPRGQAWWSWTAYRDRSLLPTVRCTSPCSPSSSRNFQVIRSNPQAEEYDLKCLSLMATSIKGIMSSWWHVSAHHRLHVGVGNLRILDGDRC